MKDLRQTTQYAKYMDAIGWEVEKVEGVYIYIKKFPLIGSFIKTQRPEKFDLQQVRNLSRRHKTFQIVIEPKNTVHSSLFTEHGFRLSKSPFLPSKTIHIELTKSEKQLLKEMHHKTRYNIKKFSISDLQFSISKDIKSFANFWQNCAKERGMFLSQKREIAELFIAFGKHAHIITLKVSARVLAAVMMICTKDTAYYMYAASTDEGKKLFAPTLAAWEAIKLAKKKGCKIFDFEGIYDERFPLKAWEGFTRFKKSFGGKVIEYPGAFQKRYGLLSRFI